ncbi:MAG: tRNA (adenine-N(6)-)-methyltransferase [Pseudanabaena frigida]|uniref:tRNA1(Val) (adenine(37)-N6)-methyltransferase n=1 Tax=Pseudanabaena frigida TaxID=945775 RepID=A0A2W4WD22_9CYAN|nr:MAG: tRNA (adenine-N(6)-)-methyltransferase [Pseudanabaena frigida]
MRNRKHSFYFKQFAIYQDKCAMKVGTDGILLGAWASISENARILDVGTGTGLLALMLAQRSQLSEDTIIDAVEIDYDAYCQATDNVKSSPWSDRINIFHSSIQDFSPNRSKQYDVIISNPPFFENAYKASQASRTLARHSDSLLQTDLLQISDRLLKPNGRLAVIYPTDLAHNFLNKAEAFNLFGDRQVNVKPTPKSAIKRILLELSKTKLPIRETLLTIEEIKHIYTKDYINLVKDFYLNL